MSPGAPLLIVVTTRIVALPRIDKPSYSNQQVTDESNASGRRGHRCVGPRPLTVAEFIARPRRGAAGAQFGVAQAGTYTACAMYTKPSEYVSRAVGFLWLRYSPREKCQGTTF
eukprot:7272149-Pyramimonas_sp.AAC.6